MTARQMQETFDNYLQLALPSAQVATKPDSVTIFRFINKAQDVFVKSKYSGNNPEGQAVEQTQKRIDELRTLVKEVKIVPTPGTVLDKPNSYIALLPTDLLYTLSEEVEIAFSEDEVIEDPVLGYVKRTGVTECTADTYRAHIDNPYGEHRVHYESARPLRLFSGNRVELITDNKYTVSEYFIRYLKQPSEIKLDIHHCELPNHTHEEIVSLAVGLFISSQVIQQDNQN